MQNQKVEMYYGSAQSYENEKRAGRIDENALYFIDGILYCGYDLYTNKYEIVDTLPAVGVKNIVYVVKSDKTVAIWDNVDNMWIFIYEPNSGGGGISETHTHDNKSVLDKITQTLLDAWNSAVSHISDTIKHITSTERKNWNDAYNKAHEHSNKTILDNTTASYTTEEKGKLSNIESGAKANVQADWSITDATSDAYIKNKPLVYTKNEVDNKFSALETNIDWKESVSTYDEIATTYPNPQDGWTVNVKDTDYTYRYDGTQWVAISANAIPKATNDVDGLLTKEDYAKISSIQNDAEVNQNAFSNVVVGSTTISADSKTDTLTLVAGSNVTITPDATNDKITISSTDTNTTYSAGAGLSLSGTTFSNSGVRSVSTGSTNGTISVDTNGTSTEVPIKGLGNAAYTNVAANLTTTEAGMVLDATMGKNLQDQISTLNSNKLSYGTATGTASVLYTAYEKAGISRSSGVKTLVIATDTDSMAYGAYIASYVHGSYLNMVNILNGGIQANAYNPVGTIQWVGHTGTVSTFVIPIA